MKRNSGAKTGSLSPPSTKRKATQTATSKAVASFFTPISKKAPAQLTWRVIDSSLLLGSYRPPSANVRSKRLKIASFDLDSTLIKPLSGNVYAKDATDWTWWDPSVPATLKKVYEEGYNVAIITNQGSVSLKQDPKTVKSDQKSLATFKTKVNSLVTHFDFPITLLAATARDQYRKPRAGMWAELLDELDLEISDGLDISSSFFVGDAGGRPARKTLKADHSCSDRNMASNAGIGFKTPEEFFLHEEPEPYIQPFEPAAYLGDGAEDAPNGISNPMTKTNDLDIVMFCGSPAAGKSTFYWTYLKSLGYERVNQDTLKTRDKCVKAASTFLSEGRSIAVGKCLLGLSSAAIINGLVDNTNADIPTRAVWIDLATKTKVPIRCVYFTAPATLCEHNDTIRALTKGSFNPEKRTILPHSAFAGFAARFQEPTIEEGFQNVMRIDFQFEGDAAQRRLWGQYWT